MFPAVHSSSHTSTAASKLYALIRAENWPELIARLPTATEEQLKYKNSEYYLNGILHAACDKAPVEVVKALIEAGCDVNQPNIVRMTTKM
jgi:hypothetical protein